MVDHKYDEETVNQAVEAVKAGASYGETGRQLKADPMTIRSWCLKAGVKSKHSKGWAWALLWKKLPRRQLDGITYKQHPKWTWLLLAREELSTRLSLADSKVNVSITLLHKLAEKNASLSAEIQAFIFLICDGIIQHCKLLVEKQSAIEEELRKGAKYFKIINVQPIP